MGRDQLGDSARGALRHAHACTICNLVMKPNRLRTLHVIVVASALAAMSACDRVFDWSLRLSAGSDLTKMMAPFKAADRVVIKRGTTSSDSRATIRDSTDRNTIIAIASFFERYPKGWHAVSGVFPDYEILLYKGIESIGSAGITNSSVKQHNDQDTISIGDYFRDAPASDVAAFARACDLDWPPEAQVK
jgi:hypothetical protein